MPELQKTPIKNLNLYKNNPRTSNIHAIKQSIINNGQFRPPIVNKGTYTGRPNEILGGNHFVQACRELAPDHPELETIDTYVIDVDDDQAKRIVLADNRTADLGDYDNELLMELLAEVPDLTGTGYTDDDVNMLMEGIESDGAVDWDSAMDALPGDEPQYITRTFTLTKDQADIVDAAVETAMAMIDDDGESRKGSAIAWICEKIGE